YIHELRALHARGQMTIAKPADSIAQKTELHEYQLNTWVTGQEPYSLAFLSPTRAIMTEKRGQAYVIENGRKAPQPITGMPEVDTGGQAGLFDVVAHPDYATNGWIYFAFADRRDNQSLTRIIRGKLRDNALVDQETIFQAQPEHYLRAGGVHFGG